MAETLGRAKIGLTAFSLHQAELPSASTNSTARTQDFCVGDDDPNRQSIAITFDFAMT